MRVLTGLDRERLDAGQQSLGLDLDDYCLDRLSVYLDMITKWNRAFNLTAAKDIRSLIDRHVLDSLACLPYVRGRRWLDVGSGAGFPGIPLAIAKPEANVDLLDSNGKIRRAHV